MKTRIITALIALPILIAAIILPLWIPQAVWLFVAIAGLALAAGLFEFYSLTKKLELKADAAIGYLGAAALFVGFLFDAPAKGPGSADRDIGINGCCGFDLTDLSFSERFF